MSSHKDQDSKPKGIYYCKKERHKVRKMRDDFLEQDNEIRGKKNERVERDSIIRNNEKMLRKAMICMDNETISPKIQQNIQDALDNNRDIFDNDWRLWELDQKVYIFEFDETEFVHAFKLLGKNHTKSAYNIRYYLNNVRFWLSEMPYDPYLVIDSGDREVKKNASEDLGVGLSSLLMVKSFGVEWPTISPIPQNRKLSRFTPDYVAFSGDEKYVFECKGTTQPHRISKIMGKALEQAKSYRGSAITKLAFVSYFPNNTKIFPTFVFVADPPLTNDLPIVDRWHALMFHYKKVLEFSNFEDTLSVFMDLLKEEVRMKISNEKESKKFEQLKIDLVEIFEKEIENLDKNEFYEKEFRGRLLDTQISNKPVRIFSGVAKNIIKRIMNLETDFEFLENNLIDGETRKVSIFSDGTILDIQIMEEYR